MEGTLDDEQCLAARIATGDRSARDALVARWTPLVARVVNRLGVRGSRYPDAIQEGLLALIEAANGYRGDEPFRYVARRAIRRAVRRFLAADYRTVPWSPRLDDTLPAPAKRSRTWRVEEALLLLSEEERAMLRGGPVAGVSGDAAQKAKREAQRKIRGQLIAMEGS